jgi:hypothetical protein
MNHIRFIRFKNFPDRLLEVKDGVCGDRSKISSRFHCGREDGVVGSVAAWGVAESDWASI